MSVSNQRIKREKKGTIINNNHHCNYLIKPRGKKANKPDHELSLNDGQVHYVYRLINCLFEVVVIVAEECRGRSM